jgi:hypothetical protein
MSMAALQDWLDHGPVNPGSIKTAICDVWRVLTSEEDRPVADEPQLMGRGLERC